MMGSYIVVRKAERVLELHLSGGSVARYPIVLGFSPDGDKEIEGDGRTPVGEFYIFTKNDKSRFHLSLGLSYPRIVDAERGLACGLITVDEYDEIIAAHRSGRKPPQKTSLGGEIYIHGGGIERESTRGCIGLRDEDIEKLFAAIDVGAKVTILP
jgi:murein L,D-transpeptidase YafK